MRAIRRAERWILERTKYTDGLAAIYPSMQYVIMALDLLGYPPDHPDRMEAQHQFDRLMVDEDGRFFFQPCFSVVWDTAIAAYALGESGLAPDKASDAMRRLAADQGSTAQGRLVGEASECGAVGLVFRVRQRVLSGHRRYGAGVAGACTGRERRIARRSRRR